MTKIRSNKRRLRPTSVQGGASAGMGMSGEPQKKPAKPAAQRQAAKKETVKATRQKVRAQGAAAEARVRGSAEGRQPANTTEASASGRAGGFDVRPSSGLKNLNAEDAEALRRARPAAEPMAGGGAEAEPDPGHGEPPWVGGGGKAEPDAPLVGGGGRADPGHAERPMIGGGAEAELPMQGGGAPAGKSGLDGSDVGTGGPPGTAERIWETAKDVGRTVKHTAERVAETVTETAQEVAETVGEGVERLREADREMRKAPPPHQGSIEQNKRTLEKLGPGDEIVFEGGANVKVRGAEVGNKFGGKVKKNPDGTYDVTLNGGGHIGADGKVKKVGGGNVKVNGDGTVTYKFKTKEDAAKGMEILDRWGRWATQANVAGSRNNPISKEEQEFLNKNIKSVEVSVGGSGEGNVEVTPEKAKKLGPFDLGLNVKGKAAAKERVRINYENGKPVSVTHGRTVTLDGSSTVGVGVGANEGEGDAKRQSQTKLGGRTGRTVTIDAETTYRLPTDVNEEQLRKDPLGTIKKLGDVEEDSSTAKVTVKDDGSIVGNGKERITTYEVNGKWKDIKESGTLADSIWGDHQTAAEKGKRHNVEVREPKTHDVTVTGIDVGWDINIGGYGGGSKLKIVTRDKHGNGNAPDPEPASAA